MFQFQISLSLSNLLQELEISHTNPFELIIILKNFVCNNPEIDSREVIIGISFIQSKLENFVKDENVIRSFFEFLIELYLTNNNPKIKKCIESTFRFIFEKQESLNFVQKLTFEKIFVNFFQSRNFPQFYSKQTFEFCILIFKSHFFFYEQKNFLNFINPIFQTLSLQNLEIHFFHEFLLNFLKTILKLKDFLNLNEKMCIMAQINQTKLFESVIEKQNIIEIDLKIILQFFLLCNETMSTFSRSTFKDIFLLIEQKETLLFQNLYYPKATYFLKLFFSKDSLLHNKQIIYQSLLICYEICLNVDMYAVLNQNYELLIMTFFDLSFSNKNEQNVEKEKINQIIDSCLGIIFNSIHQAEEFIFNSKISNQGSFDFIYFKYFCLQNHNSLVKKNKLPEFLDGLMNKNGNQEFVLIIKNNISNLSEFSLSFFRRIIQNLLKIVDQKVSMDQILSEKSSKTLKKILKSEKCQYLLDQCINEFGINFDKLILNNNLSSIDFVIRLLQFINKK